MALIHFWYRSRGQERVSYIEFSFSGSLPNSCKGGSCVTSNLRLWNNAFCSLWVTGTQLLAPASVVMLAPQWLEWKFRRHSLATPMWRASSLTASELLRPMPLPFHVSIRIKPTHLLKTPKCLNQRKKHKFKNFQQNVFANCQNWISSL